MVVNNFTCILGQTFIDHITTEESAIFVDDYATPIRQTDIN